MRGDGRVREGERGSERGGEEEGLLLLSSSHTLTSTRNIDVTRCSRQKNTGEKYNKKMDGVSV